MDPTGHPIAPLPSVPIQSDKDTEFADAIAVNAHEIEQLPIGVRNAYIQEVMIEASQQLHFEVYFWRNFAGINLADLDIDSYVGRVDLDLVTNGERIGGAGQYYLDVQLIALIRYINNDIVPANQNNLILSLVNRGPAIKAAAPAENVILKIGYIPII